MDHTDHRDLNTMRGYVRRAKLVSDNPGQEARAGMWAAGGGGGAPAKLATDVANLASTEVGVMVEPYVPGRGGSSAIPHKRNLVFVTVILAAHEQPAGLRDAEWHALPPLFGLASGAQREARTLDDGLVIHPSGCTQPQCDRGPAFRGCGGARLGPRFGREKVHALVEHAAGEVRHTGQSLRVVLDRTPRYSRRGRPGQSLRSHPGRHCHGRLADRAVQEVMHVCSLFSGLLTLGIPTARRL